MIVLVEQVAERAPIAAVNKRLFSGIKDTALAHGFKFVVDAAHHVNIREVIQLQVFADVELLFQALAVHMCHKVSDLGFSGGGQRLKQDDFEYLVAHVFLLFIQYCTLSHCVLSTRMSRWRST